jgi:hypothetical protein
MKRLISILAMLSLAGPTLWAEESSAPSDPVDAEKPVNGDGIESPKTMSGMSILGNEEAPKSLVIIPWKSSELGDEVSLSDTLEKRAQPVDKEVFLRELAYYEIRSGDTRSQAKR